jgi:hypothetical protein
MTRAACHRLRLRTSLTATTPGSSPGLFDLTTAYADDDGKRNACKALAAKLGGDPDAMFLAC